MINYGIIFHKKRVTINIYRDGLVTLTKEFKRKKHNLESLQHKAQELRIKERAKYEQ